MQKRPWALFAISVFLIPAIVLGFARLTAAKDVSGAPATISGVVRTDDGKPLRGAVVTATSGNRSVSRFTDANGRYVIAGLASGSYNVAATSWGYERKLSSKDLAGKVDMSFSLAPQ